MIRFLILVFASFVATRRRRRGRRRSTRPNCVLIPPTRSCSTPATARPSTQKAADEVTPIASLTKLMTAMVVLDAALPRDEALAVDMDDFDYLKGSRSRLRMGATLSRDEMLRLALMASENRAASALARHYPGGTAAFVAAMNAKAAALGMTQHALRGPHRAFAAQRVDGERPGAPRARRGRISADPRILHDARALRRSAADRADARLQQFQRAREERRVGYPVAKDRLHPRSRPLRRDARDDRQPADGDRAARFARHVLAASATRNASSTGSKPARRCPRRRCGQRRSKGRSARRHQRVVPTPVKRAKAAAAEARQQRQDAAALVQRSRIGARCAARRR